MLRFTRLLAVASALFLAAPILAEEDDNGPIPYGCDDLVVIGRIHTLDSYTPVIDEADLIGHGWMTARIKPRKVLNPGPRKGEITVRYSAHAPIVGDRDFLFVLSGGADGNYIIQAAALMSSKPRLAAKCS